jgi:hypothetical protein
MTEAAAELARFGTHEYVRVVQATAHMNGVPWMALMHRRLAP